MNYLLTIFNWLREHITLTLLVGATLAFFLLTQFPITFDKTTIEICDDIQITKNQHYYIRTEISKNGAEVNWCERTYYGKVTNEN